MKSVFFTVQENDQLFNQVIEEAIQQTNRSNFSNKSRWINAINKGAKELRENPNVSFDGHIMILQSATSNEIYTVNGDCQCTAFTKETPCRHRAAKRLYVKLLELIETEKAREYRAEQKKAIYNKPVIYGTANYCGTIKID